MKTTVWTVGADGSDPTPLALVPGAHSIDWHPDGKTLLVSTFGSEDGRLYVVDVDSGVSRQIGDHVSFGAWSPGGDALYYFTKEESPTTPSWRLARGRLVDGRIERASYVAGIDDYLYGYFGLAVRPCV